MGIEQAVYSPEDNPAVLNLIQKSDLRILDLGCGNGNHGRALAQEQRIIDGVTASEAEQALAQPNYREVLLWDLESGLPPALKDTAYDLMLCSHLLEHLRDPGPLLNDIHQSLKASGGKLLVALPNLLHYRHRLPLMLGKFEYTPQGVMDQTHYKWYTYTSAQRLLKEHGFELVYSGVEVNLPPHKIGKYVPQGIKNLLGKLRPGFFGYQLIFLAKPH